MLLEMPVIVNVLTTLQGEFDSIDEKGLYSRYIEIVDSVDEWRFSSGDYFSCLPYEEQRQGFSPPKLLKKRYESVDEARWLGKYSAGFRNGRHVVTVVPGQKNVRALSVDLYAENDGVIDVCSVTHKGIDRPEKVASRVTGLAKMKSLDELRKVYVAVGEGGSFAVYLYTYSSDKKPLSAVAFSKGWTSESQWDFHYDSTGELEKITSGPATLWSRT
ncbi:hypothetical protein [Burkholderia multivorans]|uniref:hypothetical protein n=1 Tax=Burkholderia multivorans TaxID=87883 RepID=UPI0012FD20FC|nr:hypothetical protein [Burkholderia multivorans]MBJ9657410.1 hypothetical protein [Burkholderia multivorans]MBU9283284.1 hypothetical protein [Burkholderia multivorans]MBU9471409.1 hypothetical protein [Burkholderia multivorans]